MLRFYPEKFLQVTDRIGRLWRAIPDDDVLLTPDMRLALTNKLNFAGNLNFALLVCEEAKLRGIKGQTDRIMHMFSTGQVRHRDLRKAIVALQERIFDGLAESFCMQIPPDKATYYNSPNLFGDDVAIKLAAANFDIEEAGKCFAAGRNTACVMHLMRVVEVGLKAYGNGLGVMSGIKAAQHNWGEVLRVSNDEIRRLNASGDPSWTPDKRSFFEGVYTHFHAVRIAWRNPTMHVENKYDEERAEDIFSAVKGFMRYLATHLDESGQFTP